MFEHAIVCSFKQTLIKADLKPLGKKTRRGRLNPASGGSFSAAAAAAVAAAVAVAAAADRCSGGTEMLIPFLCERSVACSRGWRMVANGAVYINTNRWPSWSQAPPAWRSTESPFHPPAPTPNPSTSSSAGYLDLNNLNKGIQQSRYGY